MNRLIIRENLIKKSVISIIALCIISLGAVGGCSDNGGGQDGSQAQTENDFANDPTLRDDPERGIVVDFLEPPGTETPENDTGEVGIDEIPVSYRQTLEHTFCWEDDDGEATHFMLLLDSEGSEILRVDANGECVTEVIEAGDYVMAIHHDGRMETTFPVFIIPNPEELEQARESDGLIDRFIIAAADVLKEIQETVTQDAQAQTVEENINTLLQTNRCPRCNLSRADLIGADLSGADLSGANLTDADLNGADLNGADLSGAEMIRADLILASLTDADLSGADLTDAELNGADLLFADLSGADLRFASLPGTVLLSTNFRGADLIDADLSGADLFAADLGGAELSGAVFSGATWCDNCVCEIPSIGGCVGCAPPEEVCVQNF